MAMLVTLSGIVTLLMLVQFWNALTPIVVTFFPPSVDGIERAEALPVYPVISTFPSASSLYK